MALKESTKSYLIVGGFKILNLFNVYEKVLRVLALFNILEYFLNCQNKIKIRNYLKPNLFSLKSRGPKNYKKYRRQFNKSFFSAKYPKGRYFYLFAV